MNLEELIKENIVSYTMEYEYEKIYINFLSITNNKELQEIVLEAFEEQNLKFLFNNDILSRKIGIKTKIGKYRHDYDMLTSMYDDYSKALSMLKKYAHPDDSETVYEFCKFLMHEIDMLDNFIKSLPTVYQDDYYFKNVMEVYNGKDFAIKQ